MGVDDFFAAILWAGFAEFLDVLPAIVFVWPILQRPSGSHKPGVKVNNDLAKTTC